MHNEISTEFILCPYCDGTDSAHWAQENGFTAVKCLSCGLIYVNPRPVPALIDEAVETGVHNNVDHGRTAVAHRAGSKVRRYRKILSSMFDDVWADTKRISWLDVGSGYGEILEAVAELAPPGSRVEGLEPMEPKRTAARERGLMVRAGYLFDVREQFDFVSLVNVFSHIPDFRSFLEDLKKVLPLGQERDRKYR